MNTEMRKTGVDAIGDMPWGTHLCLFYETTADLLETTVAYCKAGLEGREFCLWVIAESVSVEDAKRALQRAVPDLERFLADQSIEIVAARDWYLLDGTFNLHRVIAGWNEKLARALARGYVGARITGDSTWLETKNWLDFCEYEFSLNEAIVSQRLKVLCTYPLAACGAAEILDAVRTHQFAVTRRRGSWDVIETAGHKQAQAEIKRLNAELEQRVVERTRELTAVISQLRTEVLERQRAEKILQESQQLLQLVLATLPVGVLVTNRAGDVTLANAASSRIWGGGPIACGTERWAQSQGWWHDSGKSIAPSEWASARALSAGQTSLNELIDIGTYDGRQKTIQNSSAPIRNTDGLIVGAVIVNEDVTERVRAEKALRESAKRLQYLSRRLLTVQEDERRHLSRELHDEFGQLLATITLHLHAAKTVAGEAAQPSLAESTALLQRAGAQVRSLALELRPTMLDTGGMETTLRWLAEQHQQHTGIPTQVVGHVSDVSGDPAIAAFRVAQEALTNVVRHAQAQHIWIELSQRDGLLDLVVRDDGVGFDVLQTLERATGAGNLGLLGMKERVEILGGTLEINSQPRQGTRIRISLPLAEAVAVPGAHEV